MLPYLIQYSTDFSAIAADKRELVEISAPFDRMLIAQASVEGMVVLTADKVFRRYPVEVLWPKIGRLRGEGEASPFCFAGTKSHFPEMNVLRRQLA